MSQLDLSENISGCLKRDVVSMRDVSKLRVRRPPAKVTRRGPMIVKHTSALQLPTTSSELSVKPPVDRSCRTPSPTLSGRYDVGVGTGHFPGQGQRSTRRGSSPQVTPTEQRHRSPSLTRCNNGSSSAVGKRHISPGLDPAHAELVRRRIHRVLRARFYLLHQIGPTSFLVGGDSPDHKFKVIIGPQVCSCGHGPYCVHLLFVMLRVFQLKESDSRLYAKELKNFEVEALFRRYENRRSLRLTKKIRTTDKMSGDDGPGPDGQSPGTSRPAGAGHTQQKADVNSTLHRCEDEELCPICLLEMVDGESLVECHRGCHNKLHHHCIAIWAEERNRQAEPIVCPLCRSEWIDLPGAIPVCEFRVIPPTPPEVVDQDTQTTATLQRRHQPKQVPRRQSKDSPIRRREALQRSISIDGLGSRHSDLHSRAGAELRTSNKNLQYMPIDGGEYEDVVLPHAEPIPLEHIPQAQAWIKMFGRELVSCVYSRDWMIRETCARRLAREITGHYTGHLDDSCCHLLYNAVNILTTLAMDSVYKVYVSSLRCFRALLTCFPWMSPSDISFLGDVIKPLVQIILTRCSDSNRRTARLSIETLVELGKGTAGELAVGKHAHENVTDYCSVGGVEYVLQVIFGDKINAQSWQILLGKLLTLDRYLEDFSSEFYLRCVALPFLDSGYQLKNYDRLMTVVEFAFELMNNAHANVSKIARRVFVLASRLSTSEPGVYNQICEMVSSLDPSLQARLKRRMRAAVENLQQVDQSEVPHSGAVALLKPRKEPEHPKIYRTLSREEYEQSRASRIKSAKASRSASRSPSTRITLRSTSQSPKRIQVSASTSAINEEIPPPVPKPATKRPTHLALDLSKNKSLAPCEPPIELKLRTKPDVQYRQIKDVSGQQCGGRSVGMWVQSDSGVSSFKSEIITPTTPVPPRSTPNIEMDPELEKKILGCEDDTCYYAALAISSSLHQEHPVDEDKVPSIPGLSPNVILDDDLNPHNQNMEGEIATDYLEGSDWIRGPLLGTGAFSSCYQGRDVTTGTLMAVKLVSFCRNSEEEQEKVEVGIREEILLMARLKHPNVLRQLGATQHSQHFYMFSEWMAGGSVAHMLDQYGAFSEEVIIRYTRQILAGLSYLHDNYILHRDLKGANLLVDSTGQHLRIADFGAAAALATGKTIAGEFQGQLLGTIAFMAPEVLRGEDYGRSCDVWSVGCCIIEMGTTKPPWDAHHVSNHLALMFKIACSMEAPPIPEHFTPALRDLALQCLEVVSDQRPPAKDLLSHPAFNTVAII